MSRLIQSKGECIYYDWRETMERKLPCHLITAALANTLKSQVEISKGCGLIEESPM